jgi:hypothetical protein
VKRWEAWTNHAGWLLAAASGLLYGYFKYFAPAADPDSRLAHPLQPTVLALHVLAAPVAVFGLGLVFRRHALARLRMGERQGRRTGAWMAALAIPLAVSGYVLQVVTGDAARRWTGWGHAAAGLLFAAAYAVHPRQSGAFPDDPAKPAPEAENGL